MKDIPRRTEAEIKDIAAGLVRQQIFTADMCPPDMIPSVFMIVGLGGLADWDLDQIGNIFEWMSKANELSVNGYPTFFSCQLIHKEDWALVVSRAAAAQAAMDKAME